MASPPVDNQLDLENQLLAYDVKPWPHEEVYEIVPKHIGKVIIPLVAVSTCIALILAILLLLIILLPLATAAFLTLAFVSAVIILLAGGYGFSEWVSYKGSAMVITNYRIINVEKTNFLFTKNEEMDIKTIRNVRSAYDTNLGQFFKYGTITIERMNNDPMVIHYLPIPKVLEKQVLHYHSLVVHGGISTAHNFAATSVEDDKTPELASAVEHAKEIAKDQGIPVKT